MQAFEISEPLKARPEWSELKPRMSQPQTRESIYKKNGLYLKGTATNLKPNDGLVIDWAGDGSDLKPFRVYAVTPDNEADRTFVSLRSWNGGELGQPYGSSGSMSAGDKQSPRKSFPPLDEAFLNGLKLPPSIQPRNPTQLERSVRHLFAGRADIFPKLLADFSPRLQSALYPALGEADVTEEPKKIIYALRKVASLFGHNAPKDPRYEPEHADEVAHRKPPLKPGTPLPQDEWPEWTVAADEKSNMIFLESVFDQVLAGSYVVVQDPLDVAGFMPMTVESVTTLSRNAYGLSAKTTRLTFREAWWSARPDEFARVRATTVYCQSEELPPADEPIDEDIRDMDFELDDIHEGFESGQWMIVSGERNDIQGTSGIMTSEPVMLSQAIQDTRKIPVQQRGSRSVIDKPLPGDKLHTFLKFAAGPAYTYQRDTVTLYGNVVKATHGETRKEVLGSGDPTRPFQSFQLKVPGLTHVPAPTASGVQSTLQVWVNGVQWHEAASLAELGPTDRKFITQTNDQGITTVTFGDGQHGARPPAGLENITATYRSGIGEPGNLKASQISLIATRPLGVKAVLNPIKASGGADRETRDQARRNTPVALVALDRLVSVSDYADFARTYAGIAKARAEPPSGGRGQMINVIVAATNDNPIDGSSELLRNLREAFQRLGDPRLPILIVPRERLALVTSVKVKVGPDYLWEKLEPIVRAALLDAFGFERIQLGDDLFLADAMRVVQALPGVVYVDVNIFDVISEDSLLKGFTSSQAIDLKRKERILTGSSQLAYLAPEVPDTLILQEIKS